MTQSTLGLYALNFVFIHHVSLTHSLTHIHFRFIASIFIFAYNHLSPFHPHQSRQSQSLPALAHCDESSNALQVLHCLRKQGARNQLFDKSNELFGSVCEGPQDQQRSQILFNLFFDYGVFCLAFCTRHTDNVPLDNAYIEHHYHKNVCCCNGGTLDAHLFYARQFYLYDMFSIRTLEQLFARDIKSKSVNDVLNPYDSLKHPWLGIFSFDLYDGKFDRKIQSTDLQIFCIHVIYNIVPFLDRLLCFED